VKIDANLAVELLIKEQVKIDANYALIQKAKTIISS
jgi:hypothetical protein